jgi:orotate phosphoribosyltransferase
MTKQELARKIKEVSYLEGDFVLSSGRRSKYYLDKYLFETNPEILKALAKEMAKLLPKKGEFERLAGPEIGAIPLAAALSLETGVPYVIVRKAEKEYGTSKAIEGALKPDERVVLVEDIMTTGGQAIKAAQRIESLGGKVILLLGVIDREEGAREAVEKAGFKFKAVFTKSELGI